MLSVAVGRPGKNLRRKTTVDFDRARASLPELQMRGGLLNFHAKASTADLCRRLFGWQHHRGPWLAGENARVPAATLCVGEDRGDIRSHPGTSSPLGVARLQRDVLDHAPDLAFVEFAVNDWAEVSAHGIFQYCGESP